MKDKSLFFVNRSGIKGEPLLKASEIIYSGSRYVDPKEKETFTRVPATRLIKIGHDYEAMFRFMTIVLPFLGVQHDPSQMSKEMLDELSDKLEAHLKGVEDEEG